VPYQRAAGRLALDHAECQAEFHAECQDEFHAEFQDEC
jgi:hypothetical protein